MEKRIILKYNSNDNPDIVKSDWDLAMRRYFLTVNLYVN